MDWAVFWAATAAASVFAATIATLVTSLLRWRSRPEPDWAVLVLDISRPHPDPQYERPHFLIDGRLTNAGDGNGFRVKVSGAGCDAGTTMEQPSQWGNIAFTRNAPLDFIPVMNPGDEVRININCLGEDWEKAEIVIEWTRSPTRRRKRVRSRQPLREIAAHPAAEAE